MNTPTISKNPLKIFKIISISISLTCAVCFFLCFRFFYDENIGYFDNTPFVMISHLILLASIVFSVIFPCFLPKEINSCSCRIDSRKFKPSAVVAEAYFVFVLLEIYSMIFVGFSLIKLLLTIFAFLSLIYHYVMCTGSQIGQTRFVLLGISQIIWCTLTIAYSYFDYSVELNSPSKLLLQFACVTVMLFTTGELRTALDKPRARMYLSYSSCALSVLAAAGIGPLVASMYTNKLRVAEYIFECLIFLAMYIYILSRLICFCKKDRKDNFPENIHIREKENDMETSTDNLNEIQQ